MIAAFWLSLSAFADDMPVDGDISAVVVYLDRARVTREITVDVPAGRTDLVFDQLPLAILPASLSAEGEGSANATLTGIDFRPQRGVEDLDAQIGALKTERRVHEDAIRVQSDNLARIRSDITFVSSLSPRAPGKLEQGLFLAPDAASQLSSVAKGIGTDLLALYKEQRAAEAVIRDHEKENGRIDRELSVFGQGGGDSTRVAVGLDAAKAGRITVRLSYVVTGAGWTPHWDARYRPTDGKVRLDLSGEVRQTTGELWDDVRLTLSTARTDQSTAPPTLRPFWLAEGYSNGMASNGDYGAAFTAVEFTSKSTEDVASDGTSRRVFVQSLDLSGEIVHQVVARRVEAAWLTARVQNTAEFALLAGPMSSYMGTAYVGEGYLSATAPGSKVDLSFGVDDRVRVKRTRVSDISSDTKPLQNREKRHYGWKTVVTNRTGKAITLRVIDQVPASSESAFQVETVVTPPLTVPETGILTWEVKLEDGKSQDFTVNYDVTWPSGDSPVLME